MTRPPSFRHKLLIGASLGSLVLAGAAAAQSGWSSQSRGAGSDAGAIAARAAQDQALRQTETNSATQRALEAFRRAAQTRTQMQDAQVQARIAARAALNAVPNGLGKGGLQAAPGIEIDPALWTGAKGPVQSAGTDGRTNVSVEQTEQKAILTWDSFNVGRETDLSFNQQSADWVVLNRVRDPGASQIHGSISAKGTVLILNQNGVLFGGSSSVNVRNLVAAAANISNDQFLNRGIYSAISGANFLPSFTDAHGTVTVEAGAEIKTHAPASATQGGGYVMLLGNQVTNAGSIATAKGQTLLSAGDQFIVRRGYGTEENKYSTTRGNEVRGLIDAESTSGTVVNKGLIEAALGDITLGGRTIRQEGVIVATTGVNQRGTIHLLNSASDTLGSVTLGSDSLTAILPDLAAKDTALDGQRDALIKESANANLLRATTIGGGFDDRSMLADRLDLSRVEIVTGGNVSFATGSQTSAQGGQVAVQANAGRITVADGARIDVSGVMGVALDMASNTVMVNVQGNELRDSPANRENDKLRSQNVWIDARDLVLLPAGTGGYESDRWYTKGGLLEVGGWVGNTSHTIGEWAAVGGTVTLAASEVVAHKGATFDLSGGSVDYRAGWVNSTTVLGADGKLYDIGNAPAWMKMVAWGDAYLRTHDRWGEQYIQTWSHPIGGARSTRRWSNGYSIGRDAGKLILSAPTAIMEAAILADVLNGERQTEARPTGLTDGYKAGQQSIAQGATLAVGGFSPIGNTNPFNTTIRIGEVAAISDSLGSGAALPGDRAGTVLLDAAYLNAQKLGGLELATRGSVAINRNLTLADGGTISIVAPEVSVSATVTARAGSFSATNLLNISPPPGPVQSPQPLLREGKSSFTLAETGAIDLRGLWLNGDGHNGALTDIGRIDGGDATVEFTGNVSIARGSRIDVSSGAALVLPGTTQGGRGGNVTLIAGSESGGTAPGTLTLGGAIAGFGVEGGGKLTLTTGNRVVIGAATPVDGALNLAVDRFKSGFSDYNINGQSGLLVAEGAALDVAMPVYRFTSASIGTPSGSDPAAAFELWTPPVYQEDARAGRLIQRGGANLTLRSQRMLQGGAVEVASGATVSVDPGASITLASPGQMTVDGRLSAWGGTVSFEAIRAPNQEYRPAAHNQSIWIGEHAVIDVAGRGTSAIDDRGHRYGIAQAGGSILVGTGITWEGNDLLPDHMPDLHLVIRPGALLDASGSSATLDLPGLEKGSAWRPVTVAGDGGAIVLGAANSMYLDGTLRAAAGGAGAAGGTLVVAFDGGTYRITRASQEVRTPRVLTLTQAKAASRLGADAAPGDKLTYGSASLSVEQITAGGFDNLSIFGTMRTPDDLTLNMRQSLRLWGSLAVTGNAPAARTISLSAPYLLLGRNSYAPTGNTELVPANSTAPTPDRKDVLRIEADHIDVRGRHEYLGFSDVALASHGDLRFITSPAGVDGGRTGLFAPHLMTLTAAQIYAASHTAAYIGVGDTGGGGVIVSPARDDRLVLRSWGGNAPALPYSVNSELNLEAGVIEQGGVLRAPLGTIRIGDASDNTIVRFLPGSITSVSGAGLVMPYGGTVDGIKYLYQGHDANVLPAGGTSPGTQRLLSIQGERIEVAKGAVLDMSGGGELRGAGFVSGRGGSVDVLTTPFANANPAFGFSRPGNQVYALVPGFNGSYAPAGGETGAGAPATGRQVTIPDGVPGLPAGTYTLMPSNYALLPGAFRIEIGQPGASALTGVTPTGNGSFLAAGYLGTANTSIRSAQASQIIVTPADVVRKHSGYNETSFNDFIVADAARRSLPRGMLTVDASALALKFSRGAGLSDKAALTFGGVALFDPAKDSKGFGGILQVTTARDIDTLQVLADGQIPLGNLPGAALEASQINGFGAKRVVLGGTMAASGGNEPSVSIYAANSGVIVRSGATLRAPEMVLTALDGGTGVLVEQGATITTVGQGSPGFDSSDGYYFSTRDSAFVVSNGWVNLLPSQGAAKPTIDIGGCQSANGCTGTTRILSEGTIGAATNGAFQLRDTVSYGARDLVLAVSAVNLGSAEALAKAGAASELPPGMTLNQEVLTSLLAGNTALGTPALQSLVLNARESFNVYGSVTLDTINPATGKSRLDRLVFGAPAIYGYGSASDVATIRTGEFIWAGTVAATPFTENRPGDAIGVAPGAAIRDRLGGSTLNIVADTIRFDYSPNSRPVTLVPSDRLALGFGTVNLTASKAISADANNGALYVYRDQNGYTAGKGWSYAGGDLNITTPMLTGGAGGKLAVQAGGAIDIRGNGGAATASDQLGAELRFAGQSIRLDTAVVLPSGKLVLDAIGDVTLGDAARIDLSGREITLFDVKRYSWGGDLKLASRSGNITAAAQSQIDLSAQYNRGGSLVATALGDGAGQVALLGTIRGKATGIYDAGGTRVPYDAAQLTVRAQTLADFAGLNARLNDGELFGARRFQIRQGDLTVGDEVKAREVQIVLDSGSLTVNGRIDASGYQVGAIRLGAGRDLTINGTLDAHATGMRLDSYGKPIDAANRAAVELTARDGRLTIGSGAVVDLRAGTASPAVDKVARGTLDLIAPRVGGNDVAVDVRGTIDVRGAKTVAVYGMRSYDDAPLADLPDVTGTRPQLVTQAYLDRIDGDSRAFVDAALGNNALSARLAGLAGYRLRPGVEIVSNAATNLAGNLTVPGDIDLSGYRYGPGANRLDPARRGFGEPGMLVLRAAGDLTLHGTLTDGFAPPPKTVDDKGWMLIEGRDNFGKGYTPFGGDIVVPIDGVVLDTGTVFPARAVLNYDIAVRPVTLPAGSVVPVEVSLTGTLTLPAGQVLSADVTTAGGIRYKAGTVLSDNLVLGQGAKLGAGFQLRSDVGVGGFTLPKGTALPAELTTSGRTTLARGSLIPSMTKVELVGDAPVNLRPAGPDGRQGANWALAPMLPEGTTSWDLTLTAGADLASSDVRARNALGTGDIVLADTHYGQIGTVKIRYEGGFQSYVLTPQAARNFLGDAKYAWLTESDLNAALLADFGMDLNAFLGESLTDFCRSTPLSCKQDDGKSWVFSAEGSNEFFGTPELGGKSQKEIEAWTIANFGMTWEDLFADQNLARVCMDNPTLCVGTFKNPELNRDGALGWIGEARFAGLTAAALDAALLEAYGATFVELTGATLPDFCATNPGMCQAAGTQPAKEIRETSYSFGSPAFSVLRTGTGNLNLVAGRDVRMMSLYGVYTAGEQTSIAGIDNSRFNLPRGYEGGALLGDIQQSGDYDAALAAWQAWYPDHGGNLLVSAGRNIIGDSMGKVANSGLDGNFQQALTSSVGVGNWLWRQGTGSTTGVDKADTSWSINFGAYALPSTTSNSVRMVGFTGFGALGGGNVRVQADGDAGLIEGRGEGLRRTLMRAERSQGLVVAVGSTGRVVGNDLVLTGGGDLDIRIGGTLNPNAFVSQQLDASPLGGTTKDNLDLNGVFTNLRGTMTLTGGGMGAITPVYGADGGNVRPNNPFVAGSGYSIAAPVLMLGDATAWLSTRGDLVLSGAGDPGRVELPGTTAYTAQGKALGGWAATSFSLWTPATAVNLFSAGGDVTPMSTGEGNVTGSNLFYDMLQSSRSGYYYSFVYPAILRAVAPGGDIRLAGAMVMNSNLTDTTLMLAPSAHGQLEMLAGGSIRNNGNNYTISISGAAPSALSSPFNPAFNLTRTRNDASILASNLSNDGIGTLFAFGPNTVTTGLHEGDLTPARFYAVKGDIVGLTFGNSYQLNPTGVRGVPRTAVDWYEMATSVQLRAGTDILATRINALNANATDVSLVQAGRDIVHVDATIAGPGTLELIAGRQIRQEDAAGVRSIGSLIPGDIRPGASIAIQAGMTGVDWQAVRTRYLDPANLADPARPLADPANAGKAVKVYGAELGAWLKDRYGFTGTSGEALAYFDGLAPEQQRVFLRQVYYAETRAGGREYNDEGGPRFGSYLRGREMIATLFPTQDGKSNAISRPGDIIMFGGSGVHTDFGGDIELMAPGGQIVVGVQGKVPPASAGLVTQGVGDIRMFSNQSLLLGLSRILTTFGGDIFAWSERGDINAGRGANTTILYTPPRRIYDNYGNVRLAPQVPSSGAGIGTLNPIPEVARGDIDLIAPLGTIDAGEAGIRVSGNINLAALQVLNASNIKVQGEASGLPVVAAVNTGALTSASSAASAVANQAAQLAAQARPQMRTEIPVIISVRLLGFGDQP